jgi:predicted CXXCH cytochrome family protein
MCFSCHDGSVLDSRRLLWSPESVNHKIGVPLKEEMRAGNRLPLSNGRITCITCHTSHATSTPEEKDVQSGLFLRINNNNSGLCLNCHTTMTGKLSHPLTELNAEQKATFTPSEVKLTSIGKVSCSSCHSTHGAKTEKLLVREGVQLCRNCHTRQFIQDKRSDDPSTLHPVMQPVTNPAIRTVFARMNAKLGPNSEMICSTCHMTHNAKAAGLLVIDNTQSRYCFECHNNYKYTDIAKSPHNMESLLRYRNDQNKTISDVGVCGACHGAHKWQQRMPVITTGRTPPDMMTRKCISCHTQTGLASQKPIRWEMFNHYVGDVDRDRMRIEQDPFLKGLPDNAKRFLGRYFTAIKPRSMLTPSTITCMTCHDVHITGKMFVREEVQTGKMCTSCHEYQKEIEETVHGSKKLTKNCMSCHYMHNSPNRNLVITGERDEGCYSCHNDRATVTPPPTMREKMPKEFVLSDNGHPTNKETKTVFAAPMKPNTAGKLTCTSCHNPHEMQDQNSPLKRSFLRGSMSGVSRDTFCISCHEKNKAIFDTAHSPDPKKTVIANKHIDRKAETCDMCHKVHNSPEKRMAFNIPGAYKTGDDLCIVCHNPKGDAPEKIVDVTKGHMLGKLDKPPVVIKYLTNANGVYSIECRSCHDPHVNGPARGKKATFETSFLRKFDGVYNLCVACHDEKGSVVTSGHDVANFSKKSSEITAMINAKDVCGTCHKPHNSNRKNLMEGATSQERCQNCHNDKKSVASAKLITTSHLMNVDPKDNNTLKLPLVNNMVTCVTCHEPHRTVKNMIRPKLEKEEMLCVSCHESRRWVSSSYHNMSLTHIKDNKMKDIAARNACQPCHAAHNFDPRHAFMWAPAVNMNRDFIHEVCIFCHSRKGVSPVVPRFLSHSKLFRMLPTNQQFKQYIYTLRGRMSNEGEISCSTCHEPHVWSADPTRVSELVGYTGRLAGDNVTSFLKARTVVMKDFCILCHDDGDARYERYHMADFRAKEAGRRGVIGRLLRRD